MSAQKQWLLQFRAIVCAAAVMAPAGAAAQQVGTARVHDRNDCRSAARVIATGRPATEFESAVHRIHTCPQAGYVLGSALGRVIPGSAEEDAIIASANSIDDRRLLLAAVKLLRDPASPTRKQLAALRVVVPLINARYRVDTARYDMPEWGVLSGQVDGEPAPTASPPSSTDRETALSAIEAVGARSTTDLASRVAASIAKSLRLVAASR